MLRCGRAYHTGAQFPVSNSCHKEKIHLNAHCGEGAARMDKRMRRERTKRKPEPILQSDSGFDAENGT